MKRIIYYDGQCPLCNAWIRYIIKLDKTSDFKFAPLEGETAAHYLSSAFPNYINAETIILLAPTL